MTTKVKQLKNTRFSRFSQRNVTLCDSSKCIEYCQNNEICCHFMDHTSYDHIFSDNLISIAELEEYMKECNFYINILYTYRNISRALPIIPTHLSDDLKRNQYKIYFDILSEQMSKVHGLMELCDKLIKGFIRNIKLLLKPIENNEILWIDLMRFLNKMLDKFLILDYLKDMKSVMKNDASRYSRMNLDNCGEVMALITARFNFLNDPQHPYHNILYMLKEDIQKVPKIVEILCGLINQAVNDIKNGTYVTPDEKHGLYRCLLVSMYLLDSEEINVFKLDKMIPVKDIKVLCKKLPVIPLFMETKVSVVSVISLCYNWKNENQNDWIVKTQHKLYSLVKHRTRIHEEYFIYTCELVTLLHEIRGSKVDNNKISLYSNVFNVIVQGMKLIGSWNSKLKELVSFKTSNDGSRGDYDDNLEHTMVEIIGLIKGLSNLLLENECNLRGILTYYIHHEIQQFTHNTLVSPLSRSYKKKKDDLENMLLTMRLIISDSYDINTMKTDYKQNVKTHKFPSRKVYPTKTQVLLLKRLLNLIKKHLKKNEITQFNELFELLNNVKYLANYNEIIKECSDLSYLWFRESYRPYSKMKKPMSLAYLLVKHSINTPSLAPNIFFPLAIYNDAGEKSLSIFRQQHLYDEIEAEVNVVFDELIFTLYCNIFDYRKNKASFILLDKSFYRKMESIKDKLGKQMRLDNVNYDSICKQKCINILGRNIDIQSFLTQHLNEYIRQNLEAIINRYESGSINSVIEISHLIKTLKLTVDLLRKELPAIDPFEDILAEINDDITLGSFITNRLFLITYCHIVNGLLKNYVYNEITQRFVSLQDSKSIKKTTHSFLWGSRFTQVYHEIFKVSSSFFGTEHLHAIVELLGKNAMSLLIDELIKTVSRVIIQDLSPYVSEVLNNLDSFKHQSPNDGVLSVFKYYDIILQYPTSYPKLNDKIFSILREAGNALCLVQLLDNVLLQESCYDYQIKAYYSGNDPNEVKEDSISSNTPKESEYITILKNTLKSLKNKPFFDNEIQLLESCINNSIKRDELRIDCEGSLFSGALDYLYKSLEKSSLLKQWKGQIPKNKILDIENPKDFARFWSVITWAFLYPQEKQTNNSYMSNKTYYGDSWLWTGFTILFLTGLKYRHRILDPIIYINKLHRLYNDNNKSIKLQNMLSHWKETTKKIDLIETILNTHYEPIQNTSDKFIL